MARIRLAIDFRLIVNHPFLVFPQQCVKPRKSNVSGLPSPRLLTSFRRKAAELDEPGLFRVKLQTELLQAFMQLSEESFGIHSGIGTP